MECSSMTDDLVTSPAIRLRAAQPSDIPHVLAFIRELGEYEKLAHEVVADETTLAAQLFGEHPAAEAVIAEEEGEAVGFALFFHNFSTWTGRRGLYLEDLYVTPDARGQGAGRALLTHLARLALDRGCGRFEWSVLDWNTPAVEFYRKIGAMPMEEWTIQRVTGDALVALAARG